jgi:exosortase family protein XrtM
VIFSVTFVALQQVYLRTRTWTGDFLTHTLSAKPAAFIINAVDSRAQAVAVDARVASPRGGINIRRGCEGTEVAIILFAALVAYPDRFRRRAAGVFIGAAIVYSVNLLRIVSLFFIQVHRPDAFELAHLYLWQSVIIVIAVLFFLAWTHDRQQGQRAHA